MWKNMKNDQRKELSKATDEVDETDILLFYQIKEEKKYYGNVFLITMPLRSRRLQHSENPLMGVSR